MRAWGMPHDFWYSLSPCSVFSIDDGAGCGMKHFREWSIAGALVLLLVVVAVFARDNPEASGSHSTRRVI
jgi:hypothetical protein